MIIVEPKAELLAFTQLPPNFTQSTMAADSYSAMKTVPSDPCGEPARVVERCGRVSWKSEAKSGVGTADDFMVRVVNIRKDESIAEHVSATLLLTTDRYVTHQLVRHRLAAYTQESTHYINYGKSGQRDLWVCEPMGIPKFVPFHSLKGMAETQTPNILVNNPAWDCWANAAVESEQAYFKLLDMGVHHKHARYAMPSCLKTEIAVTYNLRMWRYVFKMRLPKANTPEITHLMMLALPILHQLCPPMFEDQMKEYNLLPKEESDGRI